MTEPQVTRLTSSVAAQIDGMTLTALDGVGIERVRAELHEHGVLVFRDQAMSREDQMAFTSRLGPVHSHPVQEFLRGGPGGDPFGIVENDANKPPQDGQNFHVDYSFDRVIPDLAVLRAEVIPPRGGDTIWSSAAAAYDALSPRMQLMLKGLEAFHEAGEKFWFEMRRTLGEDAASRTRDAFDGNRHPVVGPPSVHRSHGSLRESGVHDTHRRVDVNREFGLVEHAVRARQQPGVSLSPSLVARRHRDLG